MDVHAVQTTEDVDTLVEFLTDPSRSQVVVVVSTRSTDSRQMFDAQAIADECGAQAQVWALPASGLGLRFSDQLPEKATVFGGAARIYPRGSVWLEQPRTSPLFFAFSDDEAERKIDGLIDEAIALSYSGEAYFSTGWKDERPAPPSAMVDPSALRPNPAAAFAAARVFMAARVPAATASEPAVPAPAVVPAPRAPAPTPRPMPIPARARVREPSAELESARAELAVANSDLRLERMEHQQESLAQEIELASLRKRLADQQETRREQAASARKRRPAPETAATGTIWSPELFLDPVDAVRHAVTLAWVERVPAAEKAAYPLPEYSVGPDFAESIESLDPGQRGKAFKCVVDVLTDRAREIVSRRVHPLRSGSGGDDGPRTREDGAVCFRASIESGTASARRLHWWKGRDGSVDLSRVVVHDDMTS